MLVPIENLQSICLSKKPSCLDYLPSHYKKNGMIKCVECTDANLIAHNNECIEKCPTGFTSNGKYCYCADNTTILVNDKCMPLPACPIMMGWDSYSFSCISCNFGCLTCYDSGCTSCFPGYFLYISPQGVRCRRKSPLYPCDQQYGWIQ